MYNLNFDFVEQSCAVVTNTKPRCHYPTACYNKLSVKVFLTFFRVEYDTGLNAFHATGLFLYLQNRGVERDQ